MPYLYGVIESSIESSLETDETSDELTLVIKNDDGTFKIIDITKTNGPCPSGCIMSTYCGIYERDVDTLDDDIRFSHMFSSPHDNNENVVHMFNGITTNNDIHTITFSTGIIIIDEIGGDPYYPNGSISIGIKDFPLLW